MRLLLVSLSCTLWFSSTASNWKQWADFGNHGRHRATAIAIGNKAYMGMGHYNGTGIETYLADWWEYDPGTNAWTQKADYIGNGGNGELGALGMSLETVGYVGVGELAPQAFYKFDPALNSWTQVASPPGSPVFQDTRGFTIGHKGYFTRLWADQLYEYDADTDTWTLLNDPPFPISYSYTGFAIDGKGYIKYNDKMWEYDPTTDSWTAKATFPGYAKKSSIGFVQNGKGYIVCGYGPTHADVTSEVWEYNPVTDSWLQFPDFPGSARRYSHGLNLGNRAYLGTGTNGTNFNDWWEFDAYASLDEANALDLKVYPTLANEEVNFTSEKYAEFTVVITNNSGAIVREISAENGATILSREGLPSGTYYYQIIADESIVYANKFVFN